MERGPNNTICRKWVWKGWTLVVGQRFLVKIFMEAHTKMGLARRAKPYADVA